MMHDCFGLPLTAGDAAAVRHYDSALRKLLVLRNDPVAEVDAALRIDPGMVMGHVLKGLLCVLGTEKSLLADAHSALKAGLAVATGATPREHGHLAALSAWVGGRLHEACACWERVLVALRVVKKKKDYETIENLLLFTKTLSRQHKKQKN